MKLVNAVKKFEKHGFRVPEVIEGQGFSTYIGERTDRGGYSKIALAAVNGECYAIFLSLNGERWQRMKTLRAAIKAVVDRKIDAEKGKR